jgi:hypothetical protein
VRCSKNERKPYAFNGYWFWIASKRPAAKPPSPPPPQEETRKVAGKARASDGLGLGYAIAPPAGRAFGVSRISAAH